MTFDAKLTARHIRERADFDLIRWNGAGFERDVEQILIELRAEALKEAAEVAAQYAHNEWVRRGMSLDPNKRGAGERMAGEIFRAIEAKLK